MIVLLIINVLSAVGNAAVGNETIAIINAICAGVMFGAIAVMKGIGD